jgi:hypothetical protein
MAHEFVLILSEIEGRTMTAPCCFSVVASIAPIFGDVCMP